MASNSKTDLNRYHYIINLHRDITTLHHGAVSLQCTSIGVSRENKLRLNEGAISGYSTKDLHIYDYNGIDRFGRLFTI